MSYDIRLFLPVAGQDPLDTAQSDDEGELALTAESRRRNAQAVTALQQFDPSLEVHEFEHGVQLIAPDDGLGISIELYGDTGAISVPYWHTDNANVVLGKLGNYVRVVHDSTGFLAFDPQTDRLLTRESGFSIAEDTYAFGVDALKRVTHKPWWKFW